MYIYHIALEKDWLDAKERGVYDVSTLNKTFDEVGFIHLSYYNQVGLIASLIYSGVPSLVVLKIDTEKMDPDLLKRELSDGDYFPHYYGVIKPEWVAEVIPLEDFH